LENLWKVFSKVKSFGVDFINIQRAAFAPTQKLSTEKLQITLSFEKARVFHKMLMKFTLLEIKLNKT